MRPAVGSLALAALLCGCLDTMATAKPDDIEGFRAVYADEDGNRMALELSGPEPIRDRDGVERLAYRLQMATRTYWLDESLRWVRFDISCPERIGGSCTDRSSVNWEIQGLLAPYGVGLQRLSKSGFVATWYGEPAGIHLRQSGDMIRVDPWVSPSAPVSAIEPGTYRFDGKDAPVEITSASAEKPVRWTRESYESRGRLARADDFPFAPRRATDGLRILFPDFDKPVLGNPLSPQQLVDGLRRDDAGFAQALTDGCLAGFAQGAPIPDDALLDKRVSAFRVTTVTDTHATLWMAEARSDLLGQIRFSVSGQAPAAGPTCSDLAASSAPLGALGPFTDAVSALVDPSRRHSLEAAGLAVARPGGNPSTGLVKYRVSWTPEAQGGLQGLYWFDLDASQGWIRAANAPVALAGVTPI